MPQKELFCCVQAHISCFINYHHKQLRIARWIITRHNNNTQKFKLKISVTVEDHLIVL